MANKVNSLTEGGILSAITVIMAVIAVYVPLLGMVALLLWPLPMIVLIVRHGLKWGLMSAVVAGILTAVLIEPLTALRLTLSFAPCGLALGIGYRKKWASTSVFATGMVVSIVSKVVALGLVFFLTGIHPFSSVFDMLDQSYGQTEAFYQSINMSAGQIEAARENYTANMAMVRQLVPLIVILAGLVDTAMNFIIGGKVLRRLGHEVVAFPPFMEWRLSPGFAYLYCFSLIGMYWGQAHGMPVLQQISLNANMLGTMAGMLQGLVLYECAMEHYHISKLINMIVIVLIFFSGVFMQILVFVGIFDMVVDYRSRLFKR